MKINGQVVKLRGACIHHDNGILGAAEYKEAALRRIRRLKKAGLTPSEAPMIHVPERCWKPVTRSACM